MHECIAVNLNVMYRMLAEELAASKYTIYGILIKNLNRRKACAQYVIRKIVFGDNMVFQVQP